MRIGFDGKRAVQNFTGLGNYSRYVADILCHFYPENDYVLYAPKKRENKRMNLLTGQYRQLTLAYPATSHECTRKYQQQRTKYLLATKALHIGSIALGR